MITPYVDELNEKIKASIEADGVEVVAIAGLGMTENFEIARVGGGDIVDFAARALGDLAASRLDRPGLRLVHELRRDGREGRDRRPGCGLPVVTSNQAVLAAASARLGAGRRMRPR